MKKLQCLLIAVLMMASLSVGLSTTAFADQNSDKLSGTLSWNYVEATKTLSITGTGEIPWMRHNAPWKDFREEVETLVIGEGVTRIGANSFEQMKNLKNLTLPSTLEVIGPSAFEECVSLQDFEFPANLGRIDQSAFCGCVSLTKAILPDGITVLHGAVFCRCTSLREVHLPTNLTIIYNIPFSGCTSLTEISIPNGVIQIPYGMFYNCTSLKTVHLPRNLRSIGEYAFQNTGLEELWIPASTEVIYTEPHGNSSHAAFTACSNLKALYFLGDAPEGIDAYLTSRIQNLTLYHTAESKGWDAAEGAGNGTAVKAEIEHQLAAEASAQQPAQPEEPEQPTNPDPANPHDSCSGQPTSPSNTTADSAQPTPVLDNTPSEWAKEAVEWGKATGIMTGDSTGNLLLHSPITREQFITVLYRLEQPKNK